MEKSIQPLQRFLSDYAAFQQKHQAERLAQDKAGFSALLQGYGALRSRYQAQNKTEAYDFNLFHILNIQWAETRAHTPMLHHLLDPKGSHGQGLVFYEAFLKVLPISPEKRKTFLPKRVQDLRVIQEHYIGNGYIDIFIRGRDFAIVVENKIGAPDQHDQLKKYFAYCTTTLNIPEERVLLLYLTPQGAPPTSKSMHLDKQKELEGKKILHKISYESHIKQMLNDSMEACLAQKVKHTLHQYLLTLNLLPYE